MISLSIKISDIKNKLIEKDIKAIQKYKLKIIKEKTEDIDTHTLEEYNYYVKLIKKLRNSIRDKQTTYLSVENDLDNNIVYIVSDIDINSIEIEKPLNIKVVGAINESLMECSYYNEGRLYIKYFRSKKSNQGYGAIILRNIDLIISEINNTLSLEGLKEISVIDGKVIPDKNIINYKNLRNMYIRYGFEVDEKGNLVKYI